MTDVASFRNIYPQLQERIRTRPPINPPVLPDTPPPAPAQPENVKSKRKSKATSIISPIDQQPAAPKQDKYEMEKFFAQSMAIRQILLTMNGRLETLDVQYRTFLQSSNEAEQAKIEHEIEKVIELVNQNSLDMKAKLEELSLDNDRIEKIAEKGSGDIRMRTLHYASLLRQFSESMKNYKKIQGYFSEKQRDQIKATYLIVRPYATLAELNKLFDATGGIVLSRNDILRLGDKGDLARHLKEVRARHEGVVNIENGIRTLNQMFVDLELMIDEQGEMLDSIETSCEAIEDYLEEAAETMQEAKEYQKAIRKKKCSIF